METDFRKVGNLPRIVRCFYWRAATQAYPDNNGVNIFAVNGKQSTTTSVDLLFLHAMDSALLDWCQFGGSEHAPWFAAVTTPHNVTHLGADQQLSVQDILCIMFL